MKKVFKIIGITIGTLIGLVVISAAVVIWCIFTPERLTPIVRSTADPYITCEWDIDTVELTFFSTFPEFGLKASGLYLINPMSGAPSDTVLLSPCVVAKVDVREYLKNNNLVIHELTLKDIHSNIYIDANGVCNASVFCMSTDTTADDTTTTQLPFDSIVVNKCIIQAKQLTYLDQKDSISASLASTNLRLNMTYWDDIRLTSQLHVEHLEYKGETYAHDAMLSLDVPAEIDLSDMHIVLHQAQLAVNEFTLGLDGSVTIGDSIPVDITLQASDWSIRPLIALLPASIQSSLKDIDATGLISLCATAKGTYSENAMPTVDAHVQVNKGHGKYAALPYTFRQLTLDANAHIDLNTPSNTNVVIKQLQASTLDSRLQLRGTISDALDHMLTQAHIYIDASINDWAYFLPDSLQVNGRVQGDVNLQANLSEVINNRLNSVVTTGQMQFTDLNAHLDSLAAQIPQANVQLSANLKDWPIVDAYLDLQSLEPLHVAGDSLDATLQAPHLTASAQVNMDDTTSMPTLQTSLQWQALDGYFTDYKGHIGNSQLTFNMATVGHTRRLPAFKATLSSHNIDAYALGCHLVTQSIDIDAKSLYNEKGENLLLTWNPRMRFCLNGAELDMDGFNEHIRIPQIIFNYSNRDFEIVNSNVVLGKSDFALTGEIRQIGKWLMKKDILTGELNFTSNHTDVNELLTLFSADAGSEDTTTTTTSDSTSSDPFLVPTDVDLTLITHIKEAAVFDQMAHNLGGKIYIKDGTMVLEEIGFVCDAAKLQLTAIYRTPRRNHIYVGMDYHMLDVKIDQLISMIPQIDSMVPMLKTFKGDLEFHLAAETFLKSDYSIKTSTLLGACSIYGKNLVLMDSETFDKISKLLSFKKKTVNIVDSISAEITINKNRVDVYPFCVSMDNYMAALGGRHNLDMSFDYHVNLLSPIYLGVDVKGTMDNMSIKPAKCIYAKDFKPVLHHQVDTQNAELRQIIRNSLRKNVKIQ